MNMLPLSDAWTAIIVFFDSSMAIRNGELGEDVVDVTSTLRLTPLLPALPASELLLRL